MSKRLPVSALIITKNEEKQIARCLRSLLWVDEIVVVDAQSTDQTKQICLDLEQPWHGKIRFIEKSWAGFREQRNFALKMAKYDWVFIVDADEECTLELAQKIQTILSLPEDQRGRAYKVHRQEYFLGKEIKYGIWNPSYQDRFFIKTGIEYVNDIHEYPRFLVVPERIHESLLHFPGFEPGRFLEKMNKYTTVEAMDRVRQGQRTNLFRLFFAFPAMFFKNYFYYSAYRDGIHGFIISLLEGISRVVRHVKIWQFQNHESLRLYSHSKRDTV